MIKNYIENANFEDTGFSYTLSLISGKHKMVILYCLMEFGPVRFNELRRYVKNISDKSLSTNLKELEADGLITRREYPQIPPKVEYSLSDRGNSLMEVLDQLCVWGEKNISPGIISLLNPMKFLMCLSLLLNSSRPGKINSSC